MEQQMVGGKLAGVESWRLEEASFHDGRRKTGRGRREEGEGKKEEGRGRRVGQSTDAARRSRKVH